MAASKVYLVPWDAADPAHFERMQAQRVACGWRADEVGEWADKQAAGTKVMYWVVGNPSATLFPCYILIHRPGPLSDPAQPR